MEKAFREKKCISSKFELSEVPSGHRRYAIFVQSHYINNPVHSIFFSISEIQYRVHSFMARRIFCSL